MQRRPVWLVASDAAYHSSGHRGLGWMNVQDRRLLNILANGMARRQEEQQSAFWAVRRGSDTRWRGVPWPSDETVRHTCVVRGGLTPF